MKEETKNEKNIITNTKRSYKRTEKNIIVEAVSGIAIRIESHG